MCDERGMGQNGLVFSPVNEYIESMNNQKTPVLAKSSPSGGNYAQTQENSFNAVTMAAHKEAQDIKKKKKKTKTYHSAEEFLADLKA
jgi:NAD(P)H-hydrate repair Nnr-like enzyme with NAD(P)H-hydrate epimerase domain